MTERLTTGRIIWATIADANGIRKLRPAVIVTPAERLASPGPIDVVAITSRLPKPLPDDHVALPWHAQGHPRTRLNRPCAAVCTWLARITAEDIDDMAGVVPSPVLMEILAKVAAALPSPDKTPPADAAGPPGDTPASGDRPPAG
jgi:mRNA interferase MazF